MPTQPIKREWLDPVSKLRENALHCLSGFGKLVLNPARGDTALAWFLRAQEKALRQCRLLSGQQLERRRQLVERVSSLLCISNSPHWVRRDCRGDGWLSLPSNRRSRFTGPWSARGGKTLCWMPGADLTTGHRNRPPAHESRPRSAFMDNHTGTTSPSASASLF